MWMSSVIRQIKVSGVRKSAITRAGLLTTPTSLLSHGAHGVKLKNIGTKFQFVLFSQTCPAHSTS